MRRSHPWEGGQARWEVGEGIPGGEKSTSERIPHLQLSAGWWLKPHGGKPGCVLFSMTCPDASISKYGEVHEQMPLKKFFFHLEINTDSPQVAKTVARAYVSTLASSLS